jgi:hypothetical protein
MNEQQNNVKLRFGKNLDHADLKVSKDSINKLIPYLFEKYEYSGALNFELDKKKIKPGQFVKCKSIHKFKKGDAASVSVAKGTINFHTHPKSCYKEGETNWGWPSGDDMRECIRFMFDGTICHLVFALEGIYTIQVNPCVLHYLKNKMPVKDPKYCRGLFISLVETYFKATHGHRCWEDNAVLEKQGKKICMPQDWVKFANDFRLGSMDPKQKNKFKNKCSNALRCDGFPIEGGKAISLDKYMDMYSYQHWDYDIENMNDNPAPSKRSFSKRDFETLVSIFDKIPADAKSYGSEKWEQGQIFHVKFFSNCFKINDNSKWLSFDNWFTHMKKTCPKGKLSECIANFMLNLTPKRIVFNDTPTITFKPKIDSSGKFGFVTGKKLHKYI